MRSVFYPQLVNGPFGDPALYVRIAHGGSALLFDCGELHRLTTRELLKIQTVFISHAHLDHLVGFDHLLRTHLYQDRELLVCGPSGLIDQMVSRLRGYTWNLTEGYPFALRVREWQAGSCRQVVLRASTQFCLEYDHCWPEHEGVLYSTPDLAVKVAPLTHGDIVSLAFSLEETLHVAIHKNALEAHGYQAGPWLNSFKMMLRRGLSPETSISVPLQSGGQRNVSLGDLRDTIAHCERGMKVVYVTDAEPSKENMQAILHLAQNAHMLVIEAVFAHCDLERAKQRHHLTARLAGHLGRLSGAARLQVFHHSRRYQDEPDRLRHEAENVFNGNLEEVSTAQSREKMEE